VIEDRSRWNLKYESGDFPRNPSEIVKRFYQLASPGRALDIASGSGRNSIFLANKGFSVEALDISEQALSIFNKHVGISAACVDFDFFDIPMNRYALILNIRFLQRRLFPQIIEGLCDGGLLIFETYMVGNESWRREEHHREYMLRPNELIHSFMSLRILYYQEFFGNDSEEGRPIASLVAIKETQNNRGGTLR
jgi:tellurite methyltransferase